MTVNLTSTWFIAPGCEDKVSAALLQLAARVEAEEPGTLTYLVHRPLSSASGLQSLPPQPGEQVLFFERYADVAAFQAHVTGPLFQNFVASYGECFLGTGGKPFTTVQFLNPLAGFVERGGPGAAMSAGTNRSPAVMFEIIARDAGAARAFYSQVFGWNYQTGTGGFAYVHFPAGSPPLLGGIGQADPALPGFDPGHNFYLLVDALEPVLSAAVQAGGAPLMPPTAVDGYRFAMFRDPEGNPIGLIEPFRGSEPARD